MSMLQMVTYYLWHQSTPLTDWIFKFEKKATKLMACFKTHDMKALVGLWNIGPHISEKNKNSQDTQEQPGLLATAAAAAPLSTFRGCAHPQVLPRSGCFFSLKLALLDALQPTGI